MTDTAARPHPRAALLLAARIEIEPLKGGLSNESWLVTDAAGRHVVRLGPRFSVPPCRSASARS